ncbi:MAG: hypothetical protein ACI8X3_002590 [Saprospiraceae bacterium]
MERFCLKRRSPWQLQEWLQLFEPQASDRFTCDRATSK